MQTAKSGTYGPSSEGLFNGPRELTWSQSFGTVGASRLAYEGFHEIEFSDGDLTLKRKEDVCVVYVYQPRGLAPIHVRIHILWLDDSMPDSYSFMDKYLWDLLINRHVNNRQLHMAVAAKENKQ